MTVIQGATAVSPWEHLLDMVGTSAFSADYP